MLPLTTWNARLEKTARISGALVDGDDGDWVELRSKFVHTELQRLSDVAADVEPKGSKINGSRDAFEMPPNEESFVRREVLAKIVDGSFQLRRPVGEQDHLRFFRKSSELSRTPQSPHHRTVSIAGGGQCHNTGSTHELQKSAAVHELTPHPCDILGY